MVTSTSMKSIELNFELGVEFEETTADGRQVKFWHIIRHVLKHWILYVTSFKTT